MFSDIDNPVEGLAAAITAIPLAIAAPFIAFGEALSDLFGGSDEPDEPEIPVVDLTGPLKLDTRSLVWVSDGRILHSETFGSMDLVGRMPDLSGAATSLSGKTLRLKAALSVRRTHTSAFPAPRDPPGRGLVPVIAAALVALAFGLAVLSSRARRRRAG